MTKKQKKFFNEKKGWRLWLVKRLLKEHIDKEEIYSIISHFFENDANIYDSNDKNINDNDENELLDIQELAIINYTKLKINEQSQVIKTPIAYHIVILKNINPKKQLSFNEVKDNIIKTISNIDVNNFFIEIVIIKNKHFM